MHKLFARHFQWPGIVEAHRTGRQAVGDAALDALLNRCRGFPATARQPLLQHVAFSRDRHDHGIGVALEQSRDHGAGEIGHDHPPRIQVVFQRNGKTIAQAMRVPAQSELSGRFRCRKVRLVHAVMVLAATIGLPRHHAARDMDQPGGLQPRAGKADQAVLADTARSDHGNERSPHMTRRPSR